MFILKTIFSYIMSLIVSLQAMAALPVLSTNFRFEAEASSFSTATLRPRWSQRTTS